MTTEFHKLHPDLLPIVVIQVLRNTWVGDLNEQQIRQALRDCYDMTKRVVASGNLYAPMAFVRKRLVLCLENQALGLALPAPDSTLSVFAISPS